LPWLSTSSELRIAGRSPSNFTSTTAPNTCVMVPTLFFAIVLAPIAFRVRYLRAGLNGFGAGDDFNEFLGNLSLPRTVVVKPQPVDHVARIAGRRIHGRHLRAEERGPVFQHGAENLYR